MASPRFRTTSLMAAIAAPGRQTSAGWWPRETPMA
jgi:hypothetical protein